MPNLFRMLVETDLEHLPAEAAIVEARRRWGAGGLISVADEYRNSRLLVGELNRGRFWIRGRGSTWDLAFADADARTVQASRRKASH
jgi:hypothetical protein